jgi:hypothetical protein
MFAKLSALVGGGPSLNYNIEDPYQQAWGPWTHYAGTNRDDNSRVSVFKVSAVDPNDRVLVAARNGVKRLKMVRQHQTERPLLVPNLHQLGHAPAASPQGRVALPLLIMIQT